MSRAAAGIEQMERWATQNRSAGVLALPLRRWEVDPDGADTIVLSDAVWEACQYVASRLPSRVHFELHSIADERPVYADPALLRADLAALLLRAVTVLRSPEGVLQVAVAALAERISRTDGPAAWVWVRLVPTDAARASTAQRLRDRWGEEAGVRGADRGHVQRDEALRALASRPFDPCRVRRFAHARSSDSGVN